MRLHLCVKPFLYFRNHLDDIGEIFVTLDSHHKKHIAHAAFWSDKEDGCGTPPEPFTTISYQDLVAKKWFPKDLSLMVAVLLSLLYACISMYYVI